MSRLVITFDAVNNEKIFVIKNFLTCVFNYNNDTIELLTSTGKKSLVLSSNNNQSIEDRIFFNIFNSEFDLLIYSSNTFFENKEANKWYSRITIGISHATYNAFQTEFKLFYLNILNKKYQKSNNITVRLSPFYSFSLRNQKLYLLENSSFMGNRIVGLMLFKSSLPIKTFNVDLKTINTSNSMMTFLINDTLYFFCKNITHLSYPISSENPIAYSLHTIKFIDLDHLYFRELTDLNFIITQYRNHYDKSHKNSI